MTWIRSASLPNSVNQKYIFYQLFGRVVDYSIASATGLFNLKQRWDEALATAGIRSDQLSEPVPTTHILRGLKSQYAEQMGIEPNTPVVIGASDGVPAGSWCNRAGSGNNYDWN